MKNVNTGEIFSELTEVRFSRIRNGNYLWFFKCSCGKVCEKLIGNVRAGTTKSCGHLKNDGRANYKHGLHGTRMYRIYASAKARCTTPSRTSYRYYGGRGIRFLWKSFEDFYKDMSASYDQHMAKYGEDNTTLDRIDPYNGYSKENCRWATWEIQNNNIKVPL